jgi:acyl-CoA thioesterase
MPAADLLSDTALARDLDAAFTSSPDRARYRGELSPSWSYILPSGGVLMSIALRAMREHVDVPGMELVSATSTFCDPIPEGPFVVDVTVLRRGKAAAQLRAHLFAAVDGAPYGLEVAATFRRERPGPDAEPLRMPDVPPPVLPDPRPEGRWRFLHNFDHAPAIGVLGRRDPPRDDGARHDAHFATWHRYRITPRLASGELDPIAIPPIADTMPGALFRHLGADASRLYAPSLDLTVYFAAPTRSEWLLVETRASRARGGTAIGHAFIWDQDGHLVAQANQVMFIRHLP